MNLLYIIGNGFDIAHHMKTSYQDFFEYYLSLSSKDKDIEIMKQDIHRHKYETWADLEMGLGAYSAECVDKDIFRKCIEDIKKNLKEYLVKESEKIEQYNIKSNWGLINPGLFLDPEPKITYDEFRGHLPTNVYVNILTLNYTLTLEKLFSFKNNPISLSSGVSLQSIVHIHGTLDQMMCMGVNDTSQIANIEFRSDEDLVEDFVKPEYNDACLNHKNAICEELIDSADVIILYGSSLGPSDRKWWKLVGERIGNNKKMLLMYLAYDENKDQSATPNYMRRWTNEYISEIKNKFEINVDESVLSNRICVALNKNLLPVVKVVSKQPVKP